ncbi:hypothetical protein ACFX2I_038690 [Malus domestica]
MELVISRDRNKDGVNLELLLFGNEKDNATLRPLVELMEVLSKDADPNGVGRLISGEIKPLAESGTKMGAKKIRVVMSRDRKKNGVVRLKNQNLVK